MAAYRMTAARKAALRKAQAVSARKRRGKGKGKLAKANRSASRNKRIAVVAATGGLALAAAGVAGTYYAKKTAGGGPKSPAMKFDRFSTRRSISRARALRASAAVRASKKAAYEKSMGLKKARTVNVSLSRSKGGSLVVTKGNRRTRQRNRRRNQARFDAAASKLTFRRFIGLLK